ncbi:MAG: twitching motility protein PilT [Epulopiscium sp.]|nr:twitching motility protein PilT [Candidatus Epulonipiscium sp.]
MIQIIASEKGEGKTKQLIQHANEFVQKAKGNIVFIDDDSRPMYELHYSIRFITTEDFPIKNPDQFIGFLHGLLSRDRDIETIYIDGLLKIANIQMNELINVIEQIKFISKRYHIQFIISINCLNQHLPQSLKPFLIA